MKGGTIQRYTVDRLLRKVSPESIFIRIIICPEWEAPRRVCYSDCSDKGMWLAKAVCCDQILLPYKAEGNISRLMMSKGEQRISWFCCLVDLWTPEKPIGWMPGGFVASLQKNFWNMEIVNRRQAVLVRTCFTVETANLCFSSFNFFQNTMLLAIKFKFLFTYHFQ